jgi:hypothetical protein
MFRSLKGATDDVGSASPAAVVHLATFRADNGKEVEIFVAEGEFTRDGIEPSGLWSNAVRGSTLLVNSVDEIMSRGSPESISYHIGYGCRIDPSPEHLLQVGEVRIQRCRGPYHEDLTVSWVANAALIVYRSAGGRGHCTPYWQPAGELSDGDYSACLTTHLRVALNQVFERLQDLPRRQTPETVILPALATGTGRYPKAAFYKLFAEQLGQELRRPSEQYIPTRIVLQVRRGNDAADWDETIYAISGSIGDVVDGWRSGHSREELRSLGGLLGIFSTLTMLGGVAFFRFRASPSFDHHLSLLRDGPVALVLLAWVFAALGLLTPISLLIDNLVTYRNPVAPILSGVLTVLVYGVVYRATETYRDRVKLLHSDPTDV